MADTSLAKLREWGTHVGMDLGVEMHALTPDLVRWYVETVGDDHPWYTGASPFGGPIAPALIINNPAYVNNRSNRWYLPNRYGNLHAKQQWEFFRPAAVGETLRNRGLIVDRYLKRDREFVVAEAWLLDGSDRMVSRVRSTQSFLAGADTSGVVVDRNREKRPGRTFDLPPGDVLEELAGRRMVVTPEMCDRFSPETRNYHNDVAEAAKLGFKEVVVVGALSTCFLAELMTRRFGEGFFLGGRLAMTFVNVLWAGEAVTPQGVIRSRSREGNLWRVSADLWVEKDDGTKTVVATASALET
ncbi:MAG: hypothetical protein U0531_03585 [Dehalococcoidia bacterium]